MTIQEKLFTCPNCDRNIDIPDPLNTNRVWCTGCGREFRPVYREREEIWDLEPMTQPPQERAKNSPFSSGKEEGALREDDFEKL